VITAVLYLSRVEDVRAAIRPVAGRPLAFRMIMAAVRAGCPRVLVPACLRDTPVGRAVQSMPEASRAVSWLDARREPPGPLLLLPAAALVPPAALVPLLAAPPPLRVRASHNGDAPVLTVPEEAARMLWPSLVAGRPVAADLRRAQPSLDVRDSEAGWYARIAPSEGPVGLERQLLAGLGSPIDTRLDRALHRRLSRPITRLAIACGIGPNAITLASLLLGLASAWAFWQAEPALAVLGLALYAAAVVLDHADGEVARVTFTTSPFGAWLDVGVDTAVHAALVIALGAAAQAVAGGGSAILGAIAALGVAGSAAMVKTSPPAPGPGVGGLLDALSNRDGFYAMLLLFIAGLIAWPAALPVLMAVVAIASHAFWLGRLACWILAARTPAGQPGVSARASGRPGD
jgi:phosphatidylglycerophosphate synthase